LSSGFFGGAVTIYMSRYLFFIWFLL